MKQLIRGNLRIEDRGPAAYVWSSLAHYGLRALLPKRSRDTTVVMNEYNHERDEYWKPQHQLSVDDYVWGDRERERWILLDHELGRGTLRQVRERLLPRLKQRVEQYSAPGDLVVEFGAGTGRNLAYLSLELPDRKYLGLELTPRSVDDAHAMLRRFGLPVEMRVADVTAALDVPRAAVAYSVQALEQLPSTVSRAALANMAKIASRAIICFEPIRELFPKNMRGFAARLRQYRADYLSGLPQHARELGLDVVTAKLAGFAEHPLNELSELVIELHP
ncbi:MAG TPA: class I SAM-dependent methyltransferase [Kofleriaceae bacterium]